MLNIVLDTNVFISASLISEGHPAKIIQLWEESKFWLIISANIIDEIRRVFFYNRIRKRCPWSNKQINEFIDKVQKAGIETPGLLNLKIIKDDPTDDKYIIAAVEGNADYIVTGDQHLLKLGAYKSIRIITPTEFINIFKE